MSPCAGGRRHPFGTGVCLQELRNLLFGKIFTVRTGVAFRNTPAVLKGYHVEIAILSVDDTHLSVVLQPSLNDHAVRIFNPLTVSAQICGRRARDCYEGENQCDRLFHTFDSNTWQKSATGLLSLNLEFQNACPFANSANARMIAA